MPIPLIIGTGSGLVSATLFASAATATVLAGILFYLAPLPLCLAGLGWGAMAAMVAGLTGTIIVTATLGPGAGAVFALAAGAPIALLSYLTLLSRPVTTSKGGGTSALEWYPPGRVLGWAAIIAGLLAASMVLFFGYDSDTYQGTIKQLFEHSALKDIDRDLSQETIDSLSAMIARALPAAFAIIWLSVTLFNLWIAGLIVDASGRALRPWPRLAALELPNGIFIAFVVSLIASFLPGLPGLMATGLAGALLFAYVLQGLAVLHICSRGLPFRAVLLCAVYLGILLLGWVAIAVAILGLSEPILRLRERASLGGQPPGTE
jgi:hypothetical protein